MFTKPQSMSFISTGVSHAHVLLNNSESILFDCFVYAFLVEIGIDIPSSNAAARHPAKNIFPVMLHEEATNTLVIAIDRMKGCETFFSCDGSKKNMHHFIKVV